MIVVRVELWSAITRQKTEIARMHICNVGGTTARGNYRGEVFRGRSTEALDKRTVLKTGEVLDYPRLQKHVLNLVARMLTNTGYK